MKICVAKNRSSKALEEIEITFSQLAERLKTPVVSKETINEYLAMPRETQDNLKDVGGFVGGQLLNGRRTKKAVVNRSLIALDADEINSEENLDVVTNKLLLSNYNYIIHSTRKNIKGNPRIRILIPLEKPIKPELYQPIVRGLCSDFGMEYFDPTTVDVNRLMFWPSVCSDTKEDYIYKANTDGANLDGETYLTNRYNNWTNSQEWPTFHDELETVNRATKEQEDPLTKEGPVGIFCRAYSVPEAIDKFLPTVYEEEENNRYTYIPGSTSNGAVCFDDKFLYSFHATDPISQKLCNAFDLVRIHKFGDTKKSNDKMFELIANDSKCQELRAKEAADEMAAINISSEESTEEKDALKELLGKLTVNKKGEIESTIDNILLILNLDPNLKPFYNDVFNNWVVVTGKLPWIDIETEEYPRTWADSDDSGLQWYLEKYYNVTGERKILHALNMCFQSRPVHPVKDYLQSLTWDGVPRLETLLIDYFGAVDNIYSREVIKKALVAAVNRIYKPGVKFDNMPIIVGAQGIGKSTFLATLGKEWFSDSLTEFSGKDALELLNGNLIIEVGELTGFKKSEMDDIKQFLSKQVDEYRAAYAKRKTIHKRQCVFFGTTNESTFLRDTTGNRRFWPVQSNPERVTKSVWDDLPNEVDQIWAEAYVLYILGESLRLSPEAEKLAKSEQSGRVEEDPRKELIIDFILKKVPEDWEDRTLANLETFLEFENTVPSSDLIRRDKISALEIHCCLFGYQEGTLDQRTARGINRILDSIKGLKKAKSPFKYGSNRLGRRSIRGYYVEPEFFEIYGSE